MKTTIFPYSMVRHASLDHHLLDCWTHPHLTDEIQIQQEEQQLVSRLKEQVCEELFQKIPLVKNDKDRKKLITCKRQIFNGKQLSIELIEQIQTITKIPTLSQYFNNVQAIHERHQQNNLQYDQFLANCRAHLQQIAKHENLLNGVLLSSPLLFEQLPAYINKHPSQHKHKESKLEFSLLRYITRMCYKTSPFSTFTYTGTMQLTESHKSSNQLNQVKSQLRLNNHLFGYLINILKWHPELNEYLLVNMNSTAVENAGRIKFLINFNNIESFQQINNSTVIQSIATYLTNKKERTVLRELIHFIASQTDVPNHATIKQFLLTLCTVGYLELTAGISGIEENWSNALVQYFSPYRSLSTKIDHLLQMLEHLHNCRLEYPALTPAERHRTLKLAAQIVNNTLQAIEQQASFPDTSSNPQQQAFQAAWFRHHDFSAREIFYEDAYTSDQESLPGDPVKNIIEKTELLMKLLAPANTKRTEKEKMRTFFLSHYGRHKHIPVLTFYHDYYREIKKPEKESTPTPVGEDPWTRQIQAMLRTIISRNEPVIRLTARDFPPTDIDSTQQSRGMFIQFFNSPGTNKIKGVINALLPGLGKVNGRFLSLFDPEQHYSFQSHNEALYPDYIKAEISDGSIFNANIHPPLLPFQIVLPGGHSAFHEDNRIQVKDIEVGFDVEKNVLSLFTKGKRLYAFDLCLETISNRSNLYQLLSHFNPDNKPSLQFIYKLADDNIEMKENITLYPRITFEEDIVLRRKTWAIRKEFIPLQIQSESDYDYSLRLNNWRKQQQIPAYVFLFLRKRSKKGTGGSNDDYKPQLIHFQQPLLIELWKKLLQRAGEYIYVEEALPDPFNTKVGVKEYLLQWYNY
ncbi:lantibiotic dehydratase [Chitinophaga sp. LS1]|uniref:lantibiotic dehydratase n=1 Tax=Chitinophaga sp. LS1 TaxID=3051176 RepID=UPI002AAC1E66|nr:lantibiotic dehydratase [Chitinophaga sp. LS1]WPV66364.1 lantibiotic dehydratase [Chitinophaga sp. LS1]